MGGKKHTHSLLLSGAFYKRAWRARAQPFFFCPPFSRHVLGKTPRQWFKLNGVCQTCQLIKRGFALSMHFSVTALSHPVHSFQPPATLNKWSISAGDQTASHLTERKGRGGGDRSSGCPVRGGKKAKTWETCLEVLLEGSLRLMCVCFFRKHVSSHKYFVNATPIHAAAGINGNVELEIQWKRQQILPFFPLFMTWNSLDVKRIFSAAFFKMIVNTDGARQKNKKSFFCPGNDVLLQCQNIYLHPPTLSQSKRWIQIIFAD